MVRIFSWWMISSGVRNGYYHVDVTILRFPDPTLWNCSILTAVATMSVANGTLVVGSVTTSQGSVTTGNTAGDTTVEVDAGTIADAGSVTVTYDVLIGAGASPEISSQGTVTSDGLTAGTVTDDPADATGAADPTVTSVLPNLTIADASVFEGNGGTTQLQFTVTLGGDAAGPFTVDYSTANGTATAGSDYAAAVAQTLNFTGNAGETQIIAIDITADLEPELDETFLVNLSNENFTINNGDRIAQMIIARYAHTKWDEVNVLDETERGSGGFGSTGI